LKIKENIAANIFEMQKRLNAICTFRYWCTL